MSADLATRLRQLMLFRVVIVTTLLFIATAIVGKTAVTVEAMSETLVAVNPLYFMIVVTYALTVIHALALRFVPWLVPQAYAQVVGDLVIVTGLVHVTGGIRTGFVLLYPLSVLSASVLLPRRATLSLAGLATILYGCLLLAVRQGLVPIRGLGEVPLLPPKALLYSVFVLGVVCATVALLGSYLAESLQRAGRQLQQAAVEVADLRELNQVIVSSIQSGLMTTDVEGRILHVNAFGEAILGKPAAAVRGRVLRDVLASPLLGTTELRARAASRAFARLELVYRQPAGRRLDLGVSVTPLTTGERDREGYLVVFQDLTDVRRLEQEVRTKEKLAAVGEMAAQLAHEIRNPLGSIRGSAQVLMTEPGLGDEQGRLLDIISRESKRLSDTLNRFLYQVRPSGQPRGPIDLRPLITEAVTLLRNGPEVRPGHLFGFEADEGPHVCLADPDQMKQVFWNLARNALEAMPDGGRLDVRLLREGDEVVLSVHDQGRGMARDEQRRMFEPFHTSTAMGTGLGLAIVFRIVRDHDGDITVRSAPEEGTQIDVRLPLVSVPVPA
jgi:two-component system sensor histidine kinase PilS (NtrC family)